MKTPVIYTYTGRTVNPLALQPEDVQIEDIAHALALCNRFVGHTQEPLSVAQHSVYVARLCEGSPQFRLYALLHDASEAYLGDVSKWVKQAPEMAAYRECEARAQAAVCERFLTNWMPNPVEEEQLDWADRVMVRFEGEQGCGPAFLIDHPRYPPLTEQERQAVGPWGFWPWQTAESTFLEEFYALCAVL